MPLKLRLLFLLPLLSLFAACATVHVDRKSTVDLSKYKHVFVEHRLNDNHAIDLLIVEELKKMGRDASVGPLTMLPDNADAIITYDDDWTLDFTTHLTLLEIRLRDAKQDAPLATGRFYQQSITRNSPPDVVHQVLTQMFGGK